MKVYSFIADSAPEAVAQIRAQLGREAVVLNVRKLEADGLQKIWKKARIEVLAHLPEPEAKPAVDPLQALSALRQEIADLKQQFPRETPKAPEPAPTPLISVRPVIPAVDAPVTPAFSKQSYGGWKVGNFLEQTGVLPRYVETIISHITSQFGEKPPENIAKELDLARAAILEICQSKGAMAPVNSNGCHVFIGPPGSGKTTALSKMLTKLTLMESLPARVLRLDGARANTAESLSVYCEILGVPVERCLTEETEIAGVETIFVDLPGVSASDAEGLRALSAQLAKFSGAHFHLTLNAAYETTTLLNQVRAFSSLPISSIIFSHLDEENRWGKMLNFALGTKFALGHFSAGQNVPGELVPASVEKILSRVIPSK